MRNTAKRMIALCSMVVVLALAASITAIPAFAAPNGIYIADAKPSYRHPETGKIEDSGGDQSEILGQSMTESATYKKALVEVDKDGNTFVTIRLQLMDNVVNPQFRENGKDLHAVCMQENFGDKSVDNTADYRMQVQDENSVIRCNMTVTAMGREVVFFLTVANLRPGSEDFVTGIEVPAPTQPETPPTAAPTEAPTDAPTEAPTDAPTEAPTDAPTEAPTQAPTDAPSAPSESEEIGLQEFDSDGNSVEQTAPEKPRESHLGSFAVILAAVLVVAAAAFGIWYFAFFKKKK